MGINLRIRSALDALNLKISEASEQSGVPYRTLQNYLDGSRQPKAENLGLLCTRLGINASWLLTGDGQMLAGEVAADQSGRVNANEQALLTLWRGLDESAQQEIQRAAEEKNRLLTLENRLRELEAVVADIKRLA